MSLAMVITSSVTVWCEWRVWDTVDWSLVRRVFTTYFAVVRVRHRCIVLYV